ncbi:tRNA (adenosine(37)-N6)-threonylcarbamoyltransferase complex ATPase subunit type 1 TsaE [Peptoniphilus sp. KCTC 25270]|uniref:tRNA (adenosine(37)-N6)-threonylcarbamoyltransferase complex ATPase subunit type 1 TsaE n=1 Tax=Peptoniphilus sp. KCTC 25270 TaxID=2897414 RepID=UPI001E64EA10|nr:tRNA (adenosine(37)-N6)-threonylcarbamoyltransferase complex ATPase subunit type 1 TsaE [Peptoniphilus sp. KCTC 25270]MCD1147621.1 tRNA (adenosine(37)-N6)-threonylcarbamoyltransferase complex ATPase subunit type 1 TsaE [Peptoniphilus sp. KCTC 25270]
MKLKNIEETRKVGEFLGTIVKPYDCIALIGDLGSGKTTFTQAMAKGMGIDEVVSSATFTLINIYEGEIPLYHFDAYRLETPEAFYEIGGEEYIDAPGVSVIEWADLVMDALPEDLLILEWSRDSQEERSLTIEGTGSRSKELEKELKEFENHRL